MYKLYLTTLTTWLCLWNKAIIYFVSLERYIWFSLTNDAKLQMDRNCFALKQYATTVLAAPKTMIRGMRIAPLLTILHDTPFLLPKPNRFWLGVQKFWSIWTSILNFNILILKMYLWICLKSFSAVRWMKILVNFLPWLILNYFPQISVLVLKQTFK